MAYPFNTRSTRSLDEMVRLNAQLEAERTDLFEEIAGFHASRQTQSENHLEPLVQTTCEHIESIANNACASINKLADKQSDASKALRKFMMDNGMDRLPRKPDVFKAIFIAQLCGLAEGVLTAGQYVADGKFGLMSSIAVGAMTAVTNITAGLSIGYFSRFIGFRSNAPAPRPEDSIIRFAAKVATGIGIAGLILLHFGAARVRLTGELGDIFDFSEIGFGATFANYEGLTLMAFGAIGAVVAIYEGRNGLSDPVVGATEARKNAEEAISSSFERLYDGALSRLEDTFEDACKTVEIHHETLKSDREEHIHGLIQLMGRLSHFNNSVHSAIGKLQILQADDLKRREYVAGKTLNPVIIDFSALGKLLIDPAILPSRTDFEAQPLPTAELFTGRFALVQSTALARVDAAYQKVETFIHNLPIID